MDISERKRLLLTTMMVQFFHLRRKRHLNRKRQLIMAYLLLYTKSKKMRGPYCRNLNNSIFMKTTISKIIAGCPIETKKYCHVLPCSISLVVSKIETKSHGYKLSFEVVIFLFWLACGASYRMVSVTFDIPTTSVFNICNKMLKTFVELMTNIVKLPFENLENIGVGFSTRGKSQIFKQTAGSIDVCQVNLACSSRLNAQNIDRKENSILFQAVCDEKGSFIDVMIGFPSTVHVSQILKYSNLYRNALYPPKEYFLLGDNDYPNQINPIGIIVPYKEIEITPEQRIFNKHHSMAHSVIENAFGALKTRWRSIFLRNLEVEQKKAIKMISACICMHNICISAGDVIEVDEDIIITDSEFTNEQSQEPANDFRDQLCELLNEDQLKIQAKIKKI